MKKLLQAIVICALTLPLYASSYYTCELKCVDGFRPDTSSGMFGSNTVYFFTEGQEIMTAEGIGETQLDALIDTLTYCQKMGGTIAADDVKTFPLYEPLSSIYKKSIAFSITPASAKSCKEITE